MATEQNSRGSVVARIAGAVLGSYAFMWGFTTLTIAVALVLSFPYDDAQTFAYLLAFLVYLGAFLWAFSTRGVLRIWLVLAGGGAVMTLAAWLLTRSS
jgi:hypothetical protein